MTRREGVRQLASLAALAVAAAATIATSASPSPPASTPSAGSALVVDSEHMIAVQRLAVILNDSAIPGERTLQLTISRGQDDPSVELIVTPIVEGPQPGVGRAPAASPSPEPVVSVPMNTRADLPVTCEVAPCERWFRIVARAATPLAKPVVVTWHAEGLLDYGGQKRPAEAAMELRVDPAVSIAGARTVGAALPTEHLVLSPARPAALRIVELTVAADAMPKEGAAVTTAVLEGQRNATWYESVAFSQISPSTPESSLGFAQPFDPLAGCTPGVECRKTFLFTARWNDGVTPIDWSLRVTQLWLGGSAPASDAIRLTSRSVDIAAGQPQHLHLEGDIELNHQFVDTSTSFPVTIGPLDPKAALPVGLDRLPAPATARLSVSQIAGPTYRTTFGAAVSGGAGSKSGGISGFSTPPFDVAGNPFAASGRLAVTVTGSLQPDTDATPPAPVKLHWTLDIDLYQYEGLPELRISS